MTARPDWMLDALCRGVDPDLFFPGKGENDQLEVARTYCDRCTQRVACLNYALDNYEVHGVWGGKSERQRRRMRAQRRAIGLAA